MNGTDYAFAVARVRSNEPRLLTIQDLESLLGQTSAASSLERLAAKGWTDPSHSSQDTDILKAQREQLWGFIDEISPDPTYFDALRLANDFHNLKAAVKAVISGAPCEKLFLHPCKYEPNDLYTCIREGRFESLPEIMHTCAQKAYRAQLEQSDGQLCDIYIDKASLEASLSLACERGGMLEKLVKLRTFAANIKTAYRCCLQKKSPDFMKSALADGISPAANELISAALNGVDSIVELATKNDSRGGEQLAVSLSAFEKHIEQRELELARTARYENLSPDVLTAYIINREAEIRNVRIILTAQRNGITAERARTMLRTCS